MKPLWIVGGSLLGAIVIVVGGLYFGTKNFKRLIAEFGPEIKVNVSERGKQAVEYLGNKKGEYDRWVSLGDVALWRADAANAEEAKAAATELLALTEKYRADWNYGNAIHKANSGLGRLALQRGDLAAARGYLLASAKSKGSPQMNSFGPNMLFASEMLAAGEKDAVIEYLNLCAAFWEMEDGRIDVWKRVIAEGGSPKFGANLLY